MYISYIHWNVCMLRHDNVCNKCIQIRKIQIHLKETTWSHMLKMILAGEMIRWEQQVRFRHMCTRQYLCITADRRVTLTPDAKDPRNVFRLHPVIKVMYWLGMNRSPLTRCVVNFCLSRLYINLLIVCACDMIAYNSSDLHSNVSVDYCIIILMLRRKL